MLLPNSERRQRCEGCPKTLPLCICKYSIALTYCFCTKKSLGYLRSRSCMAAISFWWKSHSVSAGASAKPPKPLSLQARGCKHHAPVQRREYKSRQAQTETRTKNWRTWATRVGGAAPPGTSVTATVNDST